MVGSDTGNVRDRDYLVYAAGSCLWHTDLVQKFQMLFVRFVGLISIGLVTVVLGGAGSAAAAPAGTPSPPGSALPKTGIPELDTVLDNLAGNLLGTGRNKVGPNQTRQAIVVTAAKATATTGELTAFERDDAGTWKPVYGPMLAYLGAQGMGEAKDNVPRTPMSTYAPDQAFGRKDNPGTAMSYFKVTAQDWWDSDMSSPTYNKHVHAERSPGGDSENLYNSGPVYDYAVNIAHNPQRIPGKASAMFLHVTDHAPTEGGVAIEEGSMRDILRWLDPAKNPKIVIGVNKGTPTDESANTPGTETVSSEGNGFGDLVNFLISLITDLVPGSST